MITINMIIDNEKLTMKADLSEKPSETDFLYLAVVSLLLEAISDEPIVRPPEEYISRIRDAAPGMANQIIKSLTGNPGTGLPL